MITRWLYCLVVFLIVGCRAAPVPTASLFTATTGITAAPTGSPTFPPSATAPEASPTAAASPAAIQEPPLPSATPTSLALDELPPISSANAARLRILAELDFPPWELVSAVAWAPDGGVLAVSAGEWVYFFVPGTWKESGRVRIGALSPGLAFSPDGTRLAAGSRDGRVRIWEIKGNEGLTPDSPPALTVEAHRKGANRLAFSPDGSQLASGGNDAMIRIWDVNSGQELQEIIGGTYAIPDLAFSPDGTRLAIVNGDVVRLREVGSGRISGSLRADQNLYTVAWMPGTERLVTGGHSTGITLWDVSTESTVRTFNGHQGGSRRYDSLIWDVAFAAGGGLLASAGGDGALVVWDVERSEPLFTYSGPAAVTSLAFRPDDRLLAIGRLDGKVMIWGDAASSQTGTP